MLNFLFADRYDSIRLYLQLVLVVSEVLGFISELVSFRHQLADLLFIGFDLAGVQLVPFGEVFNLEPEFVTCLPCCAYVVHSIIQTSELVLQILYAMLQQLLSHSLIEVCVVELLRTRQRLP